MIAAAARPELPPPLRETLVGVAALMDAAARRPWWIIASAAVALHGADAGAVHDVDLLVDPADAERLLARPDFVRRPSGGDARFRSAIFGRWATLPVPVELMAGFEVATPQGWQPVAPTTRIAVALGGATLYVPGRVELAAQFALFGRAKDRARLAALAALG